MRFVSFDLDNILIKRIWNLNLFLIYVADGIYVPFKCKQKF
jgi:hypothetical protein